MKINVLESDEYLELVAKYNQAVSERIESEKLNKQLVQDTIDFYETKLQNLQLNYANYVS